ncbi:hypothetical protein HDU98_009882 [Podochytrium sp. JEL0797]|nr:hypothetical protein HDU98_009882 [Podochytrium sp. JEL0797]
MQGQDLDDFIYAHPQGISPPASEVESIKPPPTPSIDRRSISGISMAKAPSLSSIFGGRGRTKVSIGDAVPVKEPLKLNRPFNSMSIVNSRPVSLVSDNDVVSLDKKHTVVFSSVTSADRMRNVCQGLYQNGFVNSLYSDIVVQFLGESYNLHRLALINNKYFNARMHETEGSTLVNGKLRLSIYSDDPNMNHAAFQVLLARIYGFFDDRVTTENFKSLLATGFFFQDSDMCDMCADFIQVIEFTPTNALELITYGSTFKYGETSTLLLRHALIYLCRDGAVDRELAEHTFPQLDFKWLARIVQSDTFFVPNEFNRFEFIAFVLQKKFSNEKFSSMKVAVQNMTSHVRQLGRLPEAMAIMSPVTLTSESSVTSRSSTFELAQQIANKDVSQEYIDAAINLLSKGLVYAHIPLDIYNQIRSLNLIPTFILDRHFRIHHDIIRLVETTPKTSQELGIKYHYDKDTYHTDSFFENIMSPVYSHDQLEIPPFRFAIEFGGSKAVDFANVPMQTGAFVNPLSRVLKGPVGENMVSKGFAYAGSLWSVKIEKVVTQGVHAFEVSLVRRSGSKETTACVDLRPEAKFWCRIVAYASVDSRVTEAYTFESTGVSGLNQAARIGDVNSMMYKELYVANGVEPAACAVRFAVVLGAL